MTGGSRIFAVAPATAFFVGTALFAMLFYCPIPYFDHWDLMPFYERMANHQLTLQDLLAPHGTHWHTGGYIVMLALAPFTHLSQGGEVAASLFVIALGAIPLYFIVARTARATQAEGALALLFSVAAFFLFSLDQAENWLYGWQISLVLNVTGALVMICLLSRAQTFATLTGAMLGASIAIYSFITALALLPVGLGLIALQGVRREWRALTAWTVFCALIALHYKLGVLDATKDYTATITPQHLDAGMLGALATFALKQLGSGVGRFTDGLPLIAALAGGALALLALHLLRRRWSLRALSPVLGLLAYGLICSALIAYGRLGFDNSLAGRYISFGNFFWLGVVLLLILAAHSAQPGKSRHALAACVAVIIVCKLGVIGNVTTSRFIAPLRVHLMEVNAQICATYPNVPDALIAEISAPSQGHVRPALDFLAAHNLSLFRNCASPK